MAVSLSNRGSNSTNGNGGTFYVPTWRYIQYLQHNNQLPRNASPTPPSSSSSSSVPLPSSGLPSDMPRDPRFWGRDDVHKWLLWCQEEFDLPPIDVNQFSMNGKALCLLMKSDFNDRAPRAGDVLYNAMHLLSLQVSVNDESQRHRYDQQLRMYTQTGGGLLNSEVNNHSSSGGGSNKATGWPFVSSDYHNVGHVVHHPTTFDIHTAAKEVDSTVTLSPAPSTDSQSDSPRRDDLLLPSSSRLYDSLEPSESGGSDTASPPPVLQLTKSNQHSSVTNDNIPKDNLPSVVDQPVTSGRLLWDFLHQLLNDPMQRYGRCIAWKERDTGVFKIVDPHALAQLWGMQKNHLNMNFDKMSRALRYYYRVNILKKVQGERHCYQFLRQPTELKACKQRALLNKYTSGLQNKQVEERVKVKYEED